MSIYISNESKTGYRLLPWEEIFSKKNIAIHESVVKLSDDIENARSYFEKLKAIKEFYLKYEEEIVNLALKNNHQYFAGPDMIDWQKVFTPIEYEAWCSIRYRCMVMYPQYPVLNYFVDFGNPAKKIAIEVDGKAYHNKEKDAIRDRELLKIGWKVFRIPGGEMWNADYETFGDIDISYGIDDDIYTALINWITKTGDGVVEGIWRKYFRKDYGCFEIEGFDHAYYFEKSLNDHRLIK